VRRNANPEEGTIIARLHWFVGRVFSRSRGLHGPCFLTYPRRRDRAWGFAPNRGLATDGEVIARAHRRRRRYVDRGFCRRRVLAVETERRLVTS
jgi:hypothetical protein